MDDAKAALEFLEDVVENAKRVSSRLYGGDIPPLVIREIELYKVAIIAVKKQIYMPVKIVEHTYNPDYYCPRCGKQQKAPGYKQSLFGCFCERCGQLISFPDTITRKELDEANLVIESKEV